jgi:hypothetical protein
MKVFNLPAFGGVDQQRVNAALDRGRAHASARSQEPAVGSCLRSSLSERLGVTDPNASNDEIFAALDQAKASAKSARVQPARAAVTKPVRTAEDALYEAAFGTDDQAAAPTARAKARSAAPARPSNLSIDALYSKAFPAGEDDTDLDTYPAPTAGGDL